MPIDYGDATVSKEEMQAAAKKKSLAYKGMWSAQDVERHHEAEEIRQESVQAKKASGFFGKTKRFLGQTSEDIKAAKEGYETGRTGKGAEFYPEKQKRYYAPTKKISSALFGALRTGQKTYKEISKAYKETEGFFAAPKKSKKRDGFFDSPKDRYKGEFFSPTKKGKKSDFMSIKGTMFEKKRKKGGR